MVVVGRPTYKTYPSQKNIESFEIRVTEMAENHPHYRVFYVIGEK